MKDSISSFVLPSDKIRRHPLTSVGIALVAGFVLGLPKLRKKKKHNGEPKQNSAHENTAVTRLILEELKKVAAKRAVQYAVNSFDQNVSSRVTESDPAPEKETR
ncbi:MAG: DUF883 C-terminal domain-containing protein [Balneolaceae bacterium]